MTGIVPQTATGYDRFLHAELWPPHPDGPLIILFHDRDIAFQPEFIERLLAALPAGYETVSTNQYVGFLHASVESTASDGWQLKFVFDEPYCAYFGSHLTSWRVWLSDPMRETLRSLQGLVITVDGKTVGTVNASDLPHENLTIDIPAGLGEHIWKLSRAR